MAVARENSKICTNIYICEEKSYLFQQKRISMPVNFFWLIWWAFFFPRTDTNSMYLFGTPMLVPVPKKNCTYGTLFNGVISYMK